MLVKISVQNGLFFFFIKKFEKCKNGIEYSYVGYGNVSNVTNV